MPYREAILFWVLLVAATIGYLLSAQKPPTEWGYMEWLQALAFVCAWLIGKLQSSPLRGDPAKR
jgi:hypothetical protein